MKGPWPDNVSSRSAALRAVNRVEKWGFSSSCSFRFFPDTGAGALVGVLGMVLMFGLGLAWCWCWWCCW